MIDRYVDKYEEAVKLENTDYRLAKHNIFNDFLTRRSPLVSVAIQKSINKRKSSSDDEISVEVTEKQFKRGYKDRQHDHIGRVAEQYIREIVKQNPELQQSDL